MKRIGMINIKDILRHRHGLGLARAQIADATGVSTGTVSHVLDRASAAGLSWPLPDDLDDEAAPRAALSEPGAERRVRTAGLGCGHRRSQGAPQAPPRQADPAPDLGGSIATRRWRRGGRRTATAGSAGC